MGKRQCTCKRPGHPLRRVPTASTKRCSRTPPAKRSRFPGSARQPASTRLAEALSALPRSADIGFYPFNASVAWADSVVPGCAQWPNAAPAPPAIAPLPNVPTLILSGAQDLSTPTSGAEAVAARIPGSQLVVVPYTGHSVLGTDFSGCAQAAVKAFFSGAAVQPCAATPEPVLRPRRSPRRSSSLVKAVGGVAGRAGQHARGGARHDRRPRTTGDRRHTPGRAGTAERIELRRFARRLCADHILGASIAPTVVRGRRADHRQLPGHRTAICRPADLRVEGSQAARGTVRIGGGAHVTGTLGGRRFDVDLAKVKLAQRRARPTGTGRRWTCAFAGPRLRKFP